MLDKVIIQNLDEIDKLEVEVERDIDAVIKNIDIDALTQEPDAYMVDLAKIFVEIILQRYAKRASESGKKMAEEIEELERKVEIPISKNPKLNKEDFPGIPPLGEAPLD